MTNYINYINTQTHEPQTQLIFKKNKMSLLSSLSSCHNIATASSQYSTNATHAAKSFGIK